MGFLLVVFVVLVGFVIFLFSSKTFSPIPYFPTQKADLPLIIKTLNLKNNQTVVDLGAGDGRVIFEAAKKAFQQKFNTRFIAAEINPVLITILHLRRLFHPNRRNIKIVLDDMFNMDFNALDSGLRRNDIVFYLYISPRYMEKTILNIKKQISKFRVVSYMYQINKTTPSKKSIFIYDFQDF